jgi:hypothetical protein
MGKLLIRPQELSGNYASSHVVQKQEELAKELGFSTCLKILRHGADDFTSPPKESVLRIFTALGRV